MYLFLTAQDEKIEVYQLISESELESYQNYFSENPKIKEYYRNWLEQTH